MTFSTKVRQALWSNGIATVALTMLTSCGDYIDRHKSRSIKYDASLASGDQTPNPLPSDLNDPEDELPPLSALWTMSCNDTQAQASNYDYHFDGDGEFSLDLGQGQELAVSLSAEPCEVATERPRDVVFIVDTSGSMRENDPTSADSCGRLAAITQMVQSAAGSDTRFAIVTFASEVENASLAFFESEQNLFDDLTAAGNNGNTPVSVLCRAGGGTNYRDAFARASSLFTQSARRGAQLEAYVISDGEPDRNREGLAIAADMKRQGIVMGTVMLAGDDRVLEQQIASRDGNDKPFHVKVDMAQDLTMAIELLAKSFEKNGGVLSYRLADNDPWQDLTVDKTMVLSGPHALTHDDQTGRRIEIKFSYIDATGPVVKEGVLILD